MQIIPLPITISMSDKAFNQPARQQPCALVHSIHKGVFESDQNYAEMPLIVIQQKLFRTRIRQKIIGQILGPSEYSAWAAENKKKQELKNWETRYD
jgi:hypothetical protein